MKAEIHPEVRPVIFRDTATGALFRILSSVKTKQTMTVDGVEYPVVAADVSSASHPFYTGQQRILDSAGRVEKFGSRYGGNVSSLLKSAAAKVKPGGTAAADKPAEKKADKAEKPAEKPAEKKAEKKA